MDEYFVPGKEMVTFNKSKFFAYSSFYSFKDSAAREEIAAAGQRRWLDEHGMELRLKALLSIFESKFA